MQETYHIPVLMETVLEQLNLKPGGTYLDVTFGGGGHSQAILEAHPDIKLIGLDWDQNALDNAQPIIDKYEGRLELYWGNFAQLYKILKKYKLGPFDGILADFGTSQFQIHQKDGFSVFNDTTLDMRMSTSHFKTPASDIVNFASAEELRKIFWEFGEEKYTKPIVAAIIERRKNKRFRTTGDLVTCIEDTVGAKGHKVHPATRVFQALRIVVNQELENITAFLPAAFRALKPGGRLLCISFHSLEDRLVKQYYRDQESFLKGSVTHKRVLIASEEELAINKSARSAKLRVIEKK
jgi:16S rRNA (cytosine1402-N4)-methyltransferase